MSQINFSIGLSEVAVEYVSKAIEYSKGQVHQYLVWKAIYLYFIYLNNKKEHAKSGVLSRSFLS